MTQRKRKVHAGRSTRVRIRHEVQYREDRTCCASLSMRLDKDAPRCECSPNVPELLMIFRKRLLTGAATTAKLLLIARLTFSSHALLANRVCILLKSMLTEK